MCIRDSPHDTDGNFAPHGHADENGCRCALHRHCAAGDGHPDGDQRPARHRHGDAGDQHRNPGSDRDTHEDGHPHGAPVADASSANQRDHGAEPNNEPGNATHDATADHNPAQ